MRKSRVAHKVLVCIIVVSDCNLMASRNTSVSVGKENVVTYGTHGITFPNVIDDLTHYV